MTVSEAQKRANGKYRKEKVKQVVVRFYPSDADAYAWLKSKENVSGYLKELIRRDMGGTI